MDKRNADWYGLNHIFGLLGASALFTVIRGCSDMNIQLKWQHRFPASLAKYDMDTLC